MTFRLPLTTRLIPVAGFAALIVLAPAAAAAPTGTDDTNTVGGSKNCPTTLTGQVYVGCVPGVIPPPSAVDLRGPGQLPTVYGVPCKGSNSGTCIGLSRLPLAVAPVPDTVVRHHP